jgi:trimethylamine---corrinoid protein Co-methyltransferase
MRKGPIAGSMMSMGWGLTAFSRDVLEQIHAATLDVLQSTGVSVASDEALDILKKGGCQVNRKTQVVRFPEHVVKAALDLCPSQILLAGRDPANDYLMGGKMVGFTTFATGVQTEDLQTGAIRESTKDDVAAISRLTDALDHLDVLSSPVVPRDVPETSYALHMLEAVLNNCTKHYCGDAETKAEMDLAVEMATVVVGDTETLKRRPIISFGVCPTSPLQITPSAADITIQAARHGLPNVILSMVMAGASSPISLSGAIVTHNAEVLAAIILAQLTESGAPVIYGSSSTTFDMMHGSAVVGVPELAMISAGAVELANYYGLPSYIAGG